MALKRLLPGASEPARPGRGSKTPMQPLYMKPSPSVITPEGMPSECVMVTALPSRSIDRNVRRVLRLAVPARSTRTRRPARDAVGQPLRVALAQQPIQRHVDEGGVADMGFLVDRRALHRLATTRMYAALLWPSAAEVELLQDVEHLEQHHPAARRPVGRDAAGPDTRPTAARARGA